MAIVLKILGKGKAQEFLFGQPSRISIGTSEDSDIQLPFPVGKDGKGLRLEFNLSNDEIFIVDNGNNKESHFDLDGRKIIPGHRVDYTYGQRVSVLGGEVQIFLDHERNFVPKEIEKIPSSEIDQIHSLNVQELELINSLKKHNKMIESSHSELKNIQIKIDSLKIELSSLKKEKEEKQKEIKDIGQRYKSLNYDNGANQKKLDQLTGEVFQVDAKLTGSKIELTNLKREIGEIEEKLKEKRLDYGILIEKCEQVEKKITELRQIEVDYRNKIEQKGKSLKEVAVEAQVKQSELDKTLSMIRSLEADRVKLEREILGLNDLKASMANEINEQRIELQKIHKENESYHQDKKKIDREIHDLNTIKEGLIQDEAKHKGEILKFEDKLSQKRNELDQLKVRAEEIKRSVFDLEMGQEGIKKSLEEKRHLLRVEEEKLAGLKRQNFDEMRRFEDQKQIQLQDLIGKKEDCLNQISNLKFKIEQERESFEHIHAKNQLAVEELKKNEVLRTSFSQELKNLEQNLGQKQVQLKNLEMEIVEGQERHRDLINKKTVLDRKISDLEIQAHNLELEIREGKNRLEVELSNVRQSHQIEMYQAKQTHLKELDVLKNTKMAEIQKEVQEQFNSLYEIKLKAQNEADRIIWTAKEMESTLLRQAQDRLSLSTQEAQEREKVSHLRSQEVNEYLLKKQQEADDILSKAKQLSKELIHNSELSFQSEIQERKKKLSQFIQFKKKTNMDHLKRLEEASLKRIQKRESFGNKDIEKIKRKELRKLSLIWEDELKKQMEMRENLKREIQKEKRRMEVELVRAQREQDEAIELKRKGILDSLNRMKIEQEEKIKEKIRFEKESFEAFKKDKIKNSVKAVQDLVVSNLKIQEAFPENYREILHDFDRKLATTLEMAIDGQKADALGEIHQVLDFNPEKRKKVFNVVKKFSLGVALPLAMVAVFSFDIGSMRSLLISNVNDFLTQEKNAADVYVQKQRNDWIEKNIYNPPKTFDFKGSYTDNIVYTENYEEVIARESFQNDWILAVHDFLVKDLELSEDIAIEFISVESSLIKDLTLAKKDIHPQMVDEGISKMKQIESTSLETFYNHLREKDALDRFAKFQSDFYSGHAIGENERLPASEMVKE